MASTGMGRLPTRQEKILALVNADGFVSTDKLTRRFEVTSQTVRRDINALAALSLIERFHGGAGRVGEASNQPYEDRLHEEMTGKRAIAKRVAEVIPDGASLFLNIGTTTEALASELAQRCTSHRIVTNNINIASMLRTNPNLEIVMAGGHVRASDGGVIGESARDFLLQYRLDFGIIGVSGIEEDGALLDYDDQEIRCTRAIIESSRKVFLLADHSKFGRRASVRLGDFGDIDCLFTDREPMPIFRSAMESFETDLVIANAG